MSSENCEMDKSRSIRMFKRNNDIMFKRIINTWKHNADAALYAKKKLKIDKHQSQIPQIPPIPSSWIPRQQEQKPNFSDYMCNENKDGSFCLPGTTPLKLMRILDLAIKQGMNLLLINYKIAHIHITNKSLIHRKNKYDHDRL